MDKIKVNICNNIQTFQNKILEKFANRQSNDIVLYFPNDSVTKLASKSAIFDISNTEHFDRTMLSDKNVDNWMQQTISKLFSYVHIGHSGILFINRYDPYNDFFSPILIPIMYREDLNYLENQLKLQVLLNGGLLIRKDKEDNIKLIVIEATPQKVGTEQQKRSYLNIKVRELISTIEKEN